MGKYAQLEENIFSVFGTPEWKAEDIQTVPVNFISDTTGDYIRVAVIPSGRGINRQSCSGLLIIDIFTEAGKGLASLTEIADKLDLYLCNKVFGLGGAVVQLFASSLQPRGTDSDNASLFRGVYSIPFNYSEVLQ